MAEGSSRGEDVKELSSVTDKDPMAFPTSLSFVNLQQNAQRVGFLLKYEPGFFRRILGRSWKRKYCILSGCHFYFFKNKKGTGGEKSNGVINLRFFDRCCIPTEKFATLPNAFSLSSRDLTQKHDTIFQADSGEELQRWMKDIQLVIFQCQTQGRSEATGTRTASRTATPVLHRSTENMQRPRSSSIPEAGHVGPPRLSPAEGLVEDPEIPTDGATVARSDSRSARPDLIPRMTSYNQVVSELQSKMYTRPLSATSATREDTAPVSPRRLGSVASEDRSASQMVSSSSPVYETSGSASISSYENSDEATDGAAVLPPPFSYTSHMKTHEAAKELDSQLDSVLKMMEDLSNSENDSAISRESGRSEYAIPFKTEQSGPLVAPKPKRELYESMLPSHGAYRVSPVVNVTG